MKAINKKSGFKTDAFLAALKKNDEMNKNNVVQNDEPAPGSNPENGAFKTDAFCEALKMNEEMNKT